MKVCCIIVTYGERFKFVEKVVKEVIKQGIDKIVLIDNGSNQISANRIFELAFLNRPCVILHRFESNQGSAAGFKKGLQMAEQTDCKFIWLLDDDNLPDTDALQALKNFWIKSKHPDQPYFALASMRADRDVFQKAIHLRKSDALLWPRNSFLGFHTKLLFAKLKERLFAKKQIDTSNSLIEKPLRIDASFYGGLFIDKEILKLVQLPDENMVLYADDFCFTYPITLQQGEIWLVPDSKVKDIDRPFYLPQRKSLFYHSCLDAPNQAQIYYATRNSLYCTKKYFLTNRFVFYINKAIFLIVIGIIGLMRGKFKRLKVVFEAIRDGEKSKIEKNPKYRLR